MNINFPIGLAMTVCFTSQSAGASMDIKESVGNILSNTKTVCVGRFVIDVPRTSEIIYGPTIAGVDIRYLEKGNLSVPEIVDRRLRDLSERMQDASPKLKKEGGMLGKVVDGRLPGQKILYTVSPGVSSFYNIESYQSSGNSVFVLTAEAFPEQVEHLRIVTELNSLASKVSERHEADIPSLPGVCVKNGFISAPQSLKFESFTLGIRLAERPDVHFSALFTLKNRVVESDALEPRLIKAEQEAYKNGNGQWYSRIKMLRKRPREIGQWKGFEALARLPAQRSQGETHHFSYVDVGVPNDPLTPMVSLEMSTGVKDNKIGVVPPSISDEEAIRIWDSMLATLRVRPAK